MHVFIKIIRIQLKYRFQAAIDAAKAVLANAAATQADTMQAVNDLTSALNAFNASIIQHAPGDVNSDGTISVGDLGMVAAAIGISIKPQM